MRGMVHYASGGYAEAASELRAVLESRRRMADTTPLQLASLLGSLATVLQKQGKYGTGRGSSRRARMTCSPSPYYLDRLDEVLELGDELGMDVLSEQPQQCGDESSARRGVE